MRIIRFWLVLSEGFNRKWKAYAYVGKNSTGKIELKSHFLVNTYSNGWYVSGDELKLLCNGKKREGCEIKIVINYIPQFLLKVSLLVSVISVIFGLVLLFKKKIQNPTVFRESES